MAIKSNGSFCSHVIQSFFISIGQLFLHFKQNLKFNLTYLMVDIDCATYSMAQYGEYREQQFAVLNNQPHKRMDQGFSCLLRSMDKSFKPRQDINLSSTGYLFQCCQLLIPSKSYWTSLIFTQRTVVKQIHSGIIQQVIRTSYRYLFP